MTRRTLIATGLLAAGAAGAFAVVGPRDHVQPPEPLLPRVECVRFVSLGACAYGANHQGVFTVRNAGGGELVLHSFAASCTCSSIAQRTASGDTPIREIRLGPGASAAVVATIFVRARLNDSARSVVSFQTNDPDAPEVRVAIAASRVTGGLTPVPDSCHFGTTHVGTEVHRVVHLTDDAVAPRAVEAVVSSHPDRVRVEFTPAIAKPPGVNLPGYYIGALTIRLVTTTPAEVDSRVVIHYHDGTAKTEEVSVLGRVVGKLTATPDRVTLRPAADGGLTAMTWVRAAGKLDRATVRVSGLSGLRAEADGATAPVPVRLTAATADLPAGDGPVVVELAAEVDGETVRVPLRIDREPR